VKPQGAPGGLILTSPGTFKIPPPPLQEPGFEQLQSHNGLLGNWSHIVAGKFTSSPYSCLLFYAQSSGLVEIQQTDGAGGLRVLGSQMVRPSCTHVVPGFFGLSKLCGVLFYDQAAGLGAFYDADGQGALTHLADHHDWRKSWTHILAGRFRDLPDTDSWLSDLFFYEAEDGFAETNKMLDFEGNIGIVQAHYALGSGWTHVVGGDFIDSKGSVPIDDLFLYDASSLRCETYKRDGQGVLTLCAKLSVSDLPSASYIVPGRFAGYGPTNLLFYDRPTGSAAFMDCGYGWQSIDAYVWAQNWDIVVSGNFWMADPQDDQVFIDGAFADLFLYKRIDGRGDFYLHEPWNPTPIQPFAGYVSRRSNDPGQRISFHVSSQVGPYTIDVYRLGLQEKWMASVEPLAPPAAFPISRTAYKAGAQWPEAGSLDIPDTWPTGLYVARVQAQSILTESAGDRPASYARRMTAPGSYAPGGGPPPLDIPFVVRATAKERKRILVAISDTTYEAYNFWGGRSFYTYGREGQPIFTSPQATSFIGPYACRISFLRGTAGNWPEYDKKWQYWELPFLKWLERQSIAVDVCAESDLHFHTDLLDGYKLLVIVGHSEYWSGPMRDRVEDFVNKGGHVAVFAGNVCWWQVRFEDDGDTMVCYKLKEFDPASQSLATINWYEPDLGRPDTRFAGVTLGGMPSPVNDHLEFVVADATQWVFANTGLKNGDRFGLYNSPLLEGPATTLMARFHGVSVVGPETDRQGDPSFTRLAFVQDAKGNEIATMGMFSPSFGLDQLRGGVVFTAATMNWVLGLTLDGPGNPMDIITRNVLIRLG
jgi:hypothetical protein